MPPFESQDDVPTQLPTFQKPVWLLGRVWRLLTPCFGLKKFGTGVNTYLFFFALTTIVGFALRSQNGGYILVFGFLIFVAIVVFDLFLGYQLVRVGKQASEKLRTLVWQYSWVQLGMLLFQVDAGDCCPTPTFSFIGYYLRIWNARPQFLDRFAGYFMLLSLGLLVAQFVLFFTIYFLSHREMKKQWTGNNQQP